MAGNYISAGEVIDWTNTGTAVSSGQVVRVGMLLGVALVNIAQNQSGAVAITGVFRVPKVNARAIAQGDSLMWDASAAAFDKSTEVAATGDVKGPPAVAAAAAALADTSMLVRFTGVPGTVT